MFIAREVALQAIEATAAHLPLIAKHDRDHAKQLRNALTSVGSNLAEASGSDDGNRRARFFTAFGSCSEARMQLHLAVLYGYVRQSEAAAADQLLDRSMALFWRLTRGRRRD